MRFVGRLKILHIVGKGFTSLKDGRTGSCSADSTLSLRSPSHLRFTTTSFFSVSTTTCSVLSRRPGVSGGVGAFDANPFASFRWRFSSWCIARLMASCTAF